jgi:Flp pilus assembly protein TadB
MTTDHPPQAPGRFRSRTSLVLLAFLAMAAFFLIAEHRAHVLGVFPFLLVLLCPLLHFLHGRHSGGHAGHGSRPRERPEGGER